MTYNGIINKIKALKNYFEIFSRCYILSSNIDLKGNAKGVYFDLTERNVERYYYPLIFFFYKAGYTIFLKNNFFFLASCLGEGKRIFSIPRVFIVNSLGPNSDFIFITDKNKDKSQSSLWKKNIKINFDIYAYTEKENHIWLPFPMSPSNYQIAEKNPEENLRSKNREIGIFFSGNTNKEAYTNPAISSFFNKINRFEVIQHIKRHLSAEELVILDHTQQQKNKVNLIRKFVLMDWQWSPQLSRNLKIRVNNESWLASLADSNFFLAPPGVTMPLCHNIVEAMSVGTIPITEYPEYFNPPLTHKQNCYVYNGKEDLIIKIKEALESGQEEIRRIRNNVISYYDQNLSSESFIAKLEGNDCKDIILFMNGENVSLLCHYKHSLPIITL